MKKIFSILMALMLMIAVVPLETLAADASALESTNGNVSLGEIQNMLVDYLNDKGLSVEPGTDAYYDFILDQLLNHSDEDLHNHESYDLIHAYMAEYKVAYEDYLLCSSNTVTAITDVIVDTNDCVTYDSSTNSVAFVLTDNFLLRTIDDIIAANQATITQRPYSTMAATTSTYSGSTAAAYAKQYADGKNSIYQILQQLKHFNWK